MEAVFIMLQRQVKLFFRSKPRILGSIAQPTLFLLALGLGFGPVFEQTGQVDYVQYLTPGIVGMSLLFGSMMNGMSLIWDKKFGFLKETLVAPASRISLLIGRCLGGAFTSMFQGIVVLTLSTLIMGYSLGHPGIIPLFIIIMLMVAMLFSLLGTIIASRVDDFEAFPTVMNFLIMPMFFLSGAIFPIANLPPSVIAVTQINPMTYGVNLLRDTMNLEWSTSNITDAAVLLGIIALLLIIGSRVFKTIET